MRIHWYIMLMERKLFRDKIGQVNVVRAIAMYTVQHLTLAEIGAIAGVTAAGVKRVLDQAGVTADQGEYADVRCGQCCAPLRVARSVWRMQLNHYCNAGCYGAAHAVKDSMSAEIKQWREEELANYANE